MKKIVIVMTLVFTQVMPWCASSPVDEIAGQDIVVENSGSQLSEIDLVAVAKKILKTTPEFSRFSNGLKSLVDQLKKAK